MKYFNKNIRISHKRRRKVAAAQQSIINFHIAINYSSHCLLRLWIKRRRRNFVRWLLLFKRVVGDGRKKDDFKIHLIHSMNGCTAIIIIIIIFIINYEDDTERRVQNSVGKNKNKIEKRRRRRERKFIKINHLLKSV